MMLPDYKNSGIGTAGAAGIALMILHIVGYLTGLAWPLLYVFLILMGIGQEYHRSSKKK